MKAAAPWLIRYGEINTLMDAARLITDEGNFKALISFNESYGVGGKYDELVEAIREEALAHNPNKEVINYILKDIEQSFSNKDLIEKAFELLEHPHPGVRGVAMKSLYKSKAVDTPQLEKLFEKMLDDEAVSVRALTIDFFIKQEHKDLLIQHLKKETNETLIDKIQEYILKRVSSAKRVKKWAHILAKDKLGLDNLWQKVKSFFKKAQDDDDDWDEEEEEYVIHLDNAVRGRLIEEAEDLAKNSAYPFEEGDEAFNINNILKYFDDWEACDFAEIKSMKDMHQVVQDYSCGILEHVPEDTMVFRATDILEEEYETDFENTGISDRGEFDKAIDAVIEAEALVDLMIHRFWKKFFAILEKEKIKNLGTVI